MDMLEMFNNAITNLDEESKKIKHIAEVIERLGILLKNFESINKGSTDKLLDVFIKSIKEIKDENDNDRQNLRNQVNELMEMHNKLIVEFNAINKANTEKLLYLFTSSIKEIKYENENERKYLRKCIKILLWFLGCILTILIVLIILNI